MKKVILLYIMVSFLQVAPIWSFEELGKALRETWAGTDSQATGQTTLPRNYHGQNDTIEYNPYADKWERTQPGAQIQYNPFNDAFEMRQPGYMPMYNPFSNKWE